MSDTISRQELLSQISNVEGQSIPRKALLGIIDSMPSAQKNGLWIWETQDIYRCNNCQFKTHVDELMNEPIYDYCPYCGADMR